MEEVPRTGNFVANGDARACCALRAGMLVMPAGIQKLLLFCLGDIGVAAVLGWPVGIYSNDGQETCRLKQLGRSADHAVGVLL